MSVSALSQKLEQAERDGVLPKVVVPVHLTGSSCDMSAIGVLAERYGFAVLEDGSHAIGGHYWGEPIGNCHHSAITVPSPPKAIEAEARLQQEFIERFGPPIHEVHQSPSP